jgi:predicted XRE-type DNA-binding protein
MAVTLKEFMQDFTPDERTKVAARTAALIDEELTLRDLRRAQRLTQERVAEFMGVEQENVSRLERRPDVLLSTLSAYVAAMGGKLRIVAEFPDRRPVTIAMTDIPRSELRKPRGARRNGNRPKP